MKFVNYIDGVNIIKYNDYSTITILIVTLILSLILILTLILI